MPMGAAMLPKDTLEISNPSSDKYSSPSALALQASCSARRAIRIGVGAAGVSEGRLRVVVQRIVAAGRVTLRARRAGDRPVGLRAAATDAPRTVAAIVLFDVRARSGEVQVVGVL
mmetsp:Transcript_26414/g.66417  ORF Transcript_26414/g.66417 Transcript_26414/m.66417 type:complete len:115 (-) Transcript_26414:44-388(-)